MTDPLVAPATAWLRKALGESSLPIPSEKPVREGLNSLRMSADHKHREGQKNYNGDWINTQECVHSLFCSGYSHVNPLISKKS